MCVCVTSGGIAPTRAAADWWSRCVLCADTYIIFGEAKIEDMSAQAQSQAAEQFKAPVRALPLLPCRWERDLGRLRSMDKGLETQVPRHPAAAAAGFAGADTWRALTGHGRTVCGRGDHGGRH